jgi:hypothetical protein
LFGKVKGRQGAAEDDDAQGAADQASDGQVPALGQG